MDEHRYLASLRGLVTARCSAECAQLFLPMLETHDWDQYPSEERAQEYVLALLDTMAPVHRQGDLENREEHSDDELSTASHGSEESALTQGSPDSEEGSKASLVDILERLATSQQNTERGLRENEIKEAFLDFPGFDPEKTEFDIVEWANLFRTQAELEEVSEGQGRRIIRKKMSGKARFFLESMVADTRAESGSLPTVKEMLDSLIGQFDRVSGSMARKAYEE